MDKQDEQGKNKDPVYPAHHLDFPFRGVRGFI